MHDIVCIELQYAHCCILGFLQCQLQSVLFLACKSLLQEGHAIAYLEGAYAGFPDQSCQVCSTEAVAVRAGAHSCNTHVHCQGGLSGQSLQPPCVWVDAGVHARP